MIVHSHSCCPHLTHTWLEPIVCQWNIFPFFPDLKFVCLPIFKLLDIIIRVDQIKDRLIKHPEVFTVQVINKDILNMVEMWRETDTETAAEVIRQRLGFMYMLSAGHPSIWHLTKFYYRNPNWKDQIQLYLVLLR